MPKMSSPFKIVPAKELSANSKVTLPHVCIVSGEFVGLFRNGGLGTSMTGLAEMLAGCGGKVTVLYTGDVGDDIDEYVVRYANAGIKLEVLKRLDEREFLGRLESVYHMSNSWRVFDYLKDQSFDVIHFNDTMGEGVCSIVAKKIGLAFPKTLLTLAVHSPTEWILNANRHLADWLGFACFTGSERICIELADVVWGPSEYLLNWLVDQDYRLTDQVINQQYVVPTPSLFEPGKQKLLDCAAELERQTIMPKQIVFFGRLEERKGLRLFVASLKRISDFLNEQSISVVFLGKSSSVAGKDADVWIEENSKDWKFDWRVENGFEQKEAIAFLKDEDRLAVMASPIDNSPCTVYEAMQHRIPFLASTGGGIPELIHQDDRPHNLFDYKVGSLATLLQKSIQNGVAAARPSISIAENQARWLTMHRDWKKYLPKNPKKTKKQPKLVFLIEHENDDVHLERCLESVRSEFQSKGQNIALINRQSAVRSDLESQFSEIIDCDNPGSISNVLDGWIDDGVDGVVCIRSAMTIVEGASDLLKGIFGQGIVAFSGQLAVGNENQYHVDYTSSPAYLAYEGQNSSGIFVVDLKADKLDTVTPDLDNDRYFGGLLEQLHTLGGIVAPFPTILAHTELLDNTRLLPRGEQRRILALANADRHSSYILAGVGFRTYSNYMGNVISAIKQTVAVVATKSSTFKKVVDTGASMFRRASRKT